MDFAETMEAFRRDHSHGEFTLKAGEEAGIRESVSEGYGCYVIWGIRGEKLEVLYVGKAGTLEHHGGWKKQGLRKRLTMKQGGVYRKDFFPKLIQKRQLDGLHFEWFETFGNGSRKPPFLAEAELLAAFFREHGRLPPLNKTA